MGLKKNKKSGSFSLHLTFFANRRSAGVKEKRQIVCMDVQFLFILIGVFTKCC